MKQLDKKIPFMDLNKQYQSLKEEIDRAIFEAIDLSDFIGGNSVLNFEKKFAKKIILNSV